MPNDTLDWFASVLTGDQLVNGSPFTLTRSGTPQDLGNFVLPQGTQWVAFQFNGPLTWQAVGVVGTATGHDYGAGVVTVGKQAVIVPVNTWEDPQVDLRATPDGAGGQVTVNVYFVQGIRVYNYTDAPSPQPWQLERPYDGQVDSGEPAVGVVATCTLLGVAGKQWVAGAIMGELSSNTAGGTGRLRLRDGASGAGTILRSWLLGVPNAAGTTFAIFVTGLRIPGTPGNAMTVEFSGALAGLFESCGLAAWQV